jgi:pimeloyl-ACP methyl ester carboxylesterase
VDRFVRQIGVVLSIAALAVAPAGAEPNGAGAAPVWRVPGTPPVLSLPVTFEHAGATLHGTLYWPQTKTPVPALVAFHAADIGNGDAALYRHLREGLPAIGMAVLLFDRRGTGTSTGTRKGASYETLTDDGIAGARAIAKLPQIDPSRIGYWGLSQGGWLALFAAERDPRAAFAVSVSAPLVTPETQMEFAMANRLRVLGYPDSDVAAMLAARKAWMGYLRGTVPRSSAAAALGAIDRKPWFDLMYLPSAAQLSADPSARKELDEDPLTAIGNVRVPVLCIYGGADLWIPVAATVERLGPLARTHPNLTYAVVANASHEMMFVAHQTMATDLKSLQSDAPQAPAYFMLLASWLREHALRGRN